MVKTTMPTVAHSSSTRILTTPAALLAALLLAGPATAEAPKTWGQRLGATVLADHPQLSKMRKSDGEYRWSYTPALVGLGLYQLHRKHGEPGYYAYLKAYVDDYVDADGNIRSYAPEEFNIDSILSGRLLFPLWQDTADPRYRTAIERLRHQLRWQPRTRGGAFWHKLKYPWQVWLDGLYMGAPFYAEYVSRFGPVTDFDDVAGQFRESQAKLHDAKSGLLFHGFDESRFERWADPATGRSPGFWTRSLGWYAMALVDAWEHFPAGHPARAELASTLSTLSDALLTVRDARSKIWWQVPDAAGRGGNFLEASGSAMISYAWAKGARLGILDPRYRELARESFTGLVAELVDWNEETRRVTLRNVCRSAGLGGTPYRYGSYAYYVSTDVVADDAHGVGAFLLASAEIE